MAWGGMLDAATDRVLWYKCLFFNNLDHRKERPDHSDGLRGARGHDTGA